MATGLHANVPAFIPGQPYGYSYGYETPSAYSEEGGNDADNEADTEDNRIDSAQSFTNTSKDSDSKGMSTQFAFEIRSELELSDEMIGITD